MKKTLAAAALAATTLVGMAAAAPTPATAQVIVDYGRPYYGAGRGPGWDGYRHGYYARYHRYPARVLRTPRPLLVALSRPTARSS